MATPPDFSVGQVLTSATMNQVGLWLISSGSFTTQAAANVDSVFNSDYKNYRAIFNVSAQSTTLAYSLRFRTNGSSNSTLNYNYVQSSISSITGTTTTAAARTQAQSPLVLSTGAPPVLISLDIFSPNLSEVTFFWAEGQQSVANRELVNGTFGTTTVFDGISLIASTGTITGTYLIYGYND
jgi:hypothetical protein